MSASHPGQRCDTQTEQNHPKLCVPSLLEMFNSSSNHTTATSSVALDRVDRVTLAAERNTQTAPELRLTVSIGRRDSYAFRFRARLLPTLTQQARRALRARDRLPDLAPLLEVWEQDLSTCEGWRYGEDEEALPWQGASFSWEPASRDSVAFFAPVTD